MDRRVTPPKRVSSPNWGPPTPCKQALKLEPLSVVCSAPYGGSDKIKMNPFQARQACENTDV